MARRTGWSRYRPAIGALITMLLVAAPVVAGDFYRWVDRDGNVHYTDAPPPDAARRGPQPSPEEREREAERRETEGRRAAAQEKRKADQAREDHILRQSYTSVADIERTRDRRLSGVDGEIGLAEHRVRMARERVERYDALLGDLPADNEDRGEIERQRQEAFERLERRRHALGRLRDKRQAMEQRFARDIERFRELTEDR